MSAPTRADLLALVAQRLAKPAATEIVLRWVSELADVSDDGASLLDVTVPDGIDVNFDAQPDLLFAAFRYFFKREKTKPPVLRRLPAAHLKSLQTAFAESTLGLLTV